MLNIPYKSQWDADAKGTNNDCGPSSVAMCLAYYGKEVTTDQVFTATGAGQGVINFEQLQKASKSFGFNLVGGINKTLNDIKNLLDKGIPAIVVLHYGFLPNRQDTYQGGHIFVVRGYDEKNVYVNDPDFSGARRDEGNGKSYPIADFNKAWASTLDGNAACNLWYIEAPKGWTPDNCAKEVAAAKAEATYQEGEKDRYKKEARDSREKIKSLNTDILDINRKYADLSELYKKMLEGTTNDDDHKQLVTQLADVSEKLRLANEDIIRKNTAITEQEVKCEFEHNEVLRLQNQKYKPSEAFRLLLKSLAKE